MEENKHRVLLTVIGVGTLLIALAGATFAYFSATSTTEVQTVTTSNLNLTVTKNESTTHIENIKPTTWSDTMDTNLSNTDIAKVYFDVTSTSSAAGTYKIDMSASNLALNTGNDASGQPLKGGSLDQIQYKVYKITDDSYSAVTATASTGNFADPAAVKTIVENAAISSSLNDKYVIFVYIQNASEDQNQLQALSFDINVTGSASQA